MQTAAITVDDAAVEAFIVPWDSEVFGFPVAQVTRIDLGAGDAPAGLLQQFDDWCTEHDVRLVSCRLDDTRLRESMTLEAIGFRFIETVYEPYLDSLAAVAQPRHDVRVAEASSDDIDAIGSMAHDVFATGRYLLDWRLPPEVSKRRYARWVRTSFDGSDGQTVLKAELDGALIGFFIVERREEGTVYWHLTAIAPEWHGRGLGMSTWQTMLRRHAAEGATGVRTTISGHNTPVMNLYARLGFSFTSPQMTFHWLRG